MPHAALICSPIALLSIAPLSLSLCLDRPSLALSFSIDASLFIHDPKVAGETETKGQIKLRFKMAAGKDVVCIRSFQLTQKASKMDFKAIESVLQTINPHTGED